MKSLKLNILSVIFAIIIMLNMTACSDSSNIVNSESIPGDGIEELIIKTMGQNIQLQPSHDDDFKVAMKNDKNLSIETKGNVLTIDASRSSKIINFKSETLIIEFPERVYNTIDVVTASGNISGKDIQAENLILTVSSGDIYLNGFKGNRIHGDVVSGNVTLEKITGSMQIANETGVTSIQHDGNFIDDSNISTLSGKINFTFKNEPQNVFIDVSTEAGNIQTTLFSSNMIQSQGGGKKLFAELGSGGSTLTLKSSSGLITLN
ncbi:DUF4097 family beta strand repeat-containing protein [Alkalihalobacterium bogoriense]|uniref:DUF4097 family beta strand repeat-containing protein n=1 Tax=Alkalihalobacterium bogoriense TaxID=246272 RepID=UPI00047EDD7D|nr:DUF4097 family beta strand repeat-containing protein [Alkalihalobacterium bogoriense]